MRRVAAFATSVVCCAATVSESVFTTIFPSTIASCGAMLDCWGGAAGAGCCCAVAAAAAAAAVDVVAAACARLAFLFSLAASAPALATAMPCAVAE
eukprot:CAMPEP_0119192584 /NCGR_PEP_ID=MMETSP1316-20130426/3040_1 /TAXON_ID=41880 /ORGANISM="Pycnococcus provasolii, Strain RCC2336" /LENGTH=95 /DNA_ID=CAMNT_0007187767 /DNA_START=141 /DNA_END=425 /DNA_ORIENTATION=-